MIKKIKDFLKSINSKKQITTISNKEMIGELTTEKLEKILAGSVAATNYSAGTTMSTIYTGNVFTGTGTNTVTVGSGSSVLTGGAGGAGGIYWTNTNTNYTTWPTTLSGSGLTITGDADIEGELKIKGISVSDRLDEIEKRLAILQYNPKLEEKWSDLKQLGDQYREMEKDILEKEQIWDILKK